MRPFSAKCSAVMPPVTAAFTEPRREAGAASSSCIVAASPIIAARISGVGACSSGPSGGRGPAPAPAASDAADAADAADDDASGESELQRWARTRARASTSTAAATGPPLLSEVADSSLPASMLAFFLGALAGLPPPLRIVGAVGAARRGGGAGPAADAGAIHRACSIPVW